MRTLLVLFVSLVALYMLATVCYGLGLAVVLLVQ
jgi:hypothetical protein